GGKGPPSNRVSPRGGTRPGGRRGSGTRGRGSRRRREVVSYLIMTAALGRARWWIQRPRGTRRYNRRDRRGFAGHSSREFVERELLPAAEEFKAVEPGVVRDAERGAAPDRRRD